MHTVNDGSQQSGLKGLKLTHDFLTPLQKAGNLYSQAIDTYLTKQMIFTDTS